MKNKFIKGRGGWLMCTHFIFFLQKNNTISHFFFSFPFSKNFIIFNYQVFFILLAFLAMTSLLTREESKGGHGKEKDRKSHC